MRALALLILLFPLTLFADRIVLTDGKEYRGTFLDAENGKVRFRISSRVVRTFPAANIARLEIGNKVPSAAYRAATPQDADRQMRPRTPIQQTQTETVSSQPAPPAQPVVTEPQLGTPTTSPVQGADSIDSEYTRMGSETGALGPPRAAHQATADGRASARFYNSGVVYWTPGAGAHALTGPILQAWLS